MSLRSIELIHAAVPLKKAIKHASHERTTSDNLVVRATLRSGEVGYGEGVPRPYVTGETIDSAFEMLRGFDVARVVGEPGDYQALVRSLEGLVLPETRNDPRGMMGNAARCALELALLDAYGRRFRTSVSSAIRGVEAIRPYLAAKPSPVRYSGAITAETERKERISAWKMRIWGFHQVKIKVGVPGQDDPKRLETLRKILGRRMDIRLDANEAWKAEEVLDRMEPLKPFGPSAIEQPVRHEEVDALADLRPKMGIPVMLDESLCGRPDAERAIERGLADILNVRISKCGGLIPSLEIAALAFRNGLDVQLGCHPGETAILSAAGRHFASNVVNLRYVEGSYDKHILGANVVMAENDISFGYGGRARPLGGAGLGIAVDRQALEAFSVRREEVVYD
ncbi:MAG TPA: dipeptide epimerase [Isosphaeraceae bacterium]|nr:dipeptide epimerase [Isosphaeraceae bacterium]